MGRIKYSVFASVKMTLWSVKDNPLLNTLQSVLLLSLCSSYHLLSVFLSLCSSHYLIVCTSSESVFIMSFYSLYLWVCVNHMILQYALLLSLCSSYHFTVYTSESVFIISSYSLHFLCVHHIILQTVLPSLCSSSHFTVCTSESVFIISFYSLYFWVCAHHLILQSVLLSLCSSYNFNRFFPFDEILLGWLFVTDGTLKSNEKLFRC